MDGNINTNSNANWGSAGNMFMVNTNFSAQWVAQRPDPLVYNWCTATWDSPYGSSTCNSPTNCNGGQGTTDPWWAVDLGSVQNIDFLSIYGRTDCCSGRNAGFKLYYGNTNTSLQWNDPSVKEYVHGFSDLTTTNVIIPTPGIQARYIWYRLPGAGRILTLCEFQVWQKKPFVWRKLSGTFNAAFNKYATQSSTMNGWSNGYAGRAVDGIQTNNYDAAPSSCMHTGNTELVGTYAYWMVDLGDVYDVQSMDVWARTDCCTNRNVGFEWLVGMSTDHTMDSKCANGLATLVSISSNCCWLLLLWFANVATIRRQIHLCCATCIASHASTRFLSMPCSSSPIAGATGRSRLRVLHLPPPRPLRVRAQVHQHLQRGSQLHHVVRGEPSA